MKSVFANLNQSQKRWITWAAVVLILGLMFLLAFYSSKGIFGDPGDSGTTDEVAHIPSGYTYDKDQDFRLNPEHPPLAKALAGLPLVLQKDIKGPETNWSWNGINQWDSGWFMLYHAGNNPAQVLIWARLPMVLLMIVLGLFLFKWASELFGRKAGLIVLLLYAFYPDVLAHGRLVTTDIAAALGYVITVYYFDKALQKLTVKSTVFAGVAFGLAQLLKFSSFLLYGVLFILIVAKAILERKESSFWQKLWQYFKIYFWTSILSLVVVWLVYLFFVWKTPTGIEHQLIESNMTQDARTLPLRNFLHLLEGNPWTRAIGHYLLGVFLVIGRVGGGNATFAHGTLSEKSISWYFPFAWLIKTPISIILLFISSLIFTFVQWGKNRKSLWVLSLILVPWLVYWIFTLKGSLNIGIRHLIPTVPFVLLMIGFGLKQWVDLKKLWLNLIIGALILYMIVSTVTYFPGFIGYFNETVPRNERYKYLIDSSLDWGQDLLRLKKYVDDNHVADIKVDYFGGSEAKYYLPFSQPWHSSYGPTSGWIAISATYYQSSKLYGPKEGKWSYAWLDQYKPTAEIGGSILVFHITPEELSLNPPKMDYTVTKIDPIGSLDNLNK